MEMEKERAEETRPKSEAESSKNVLSCWAAWHLWCWRPVGKEGLVQFDLRPSALARQRFAASSSSGQ